MSLSKDKAGTLCNVHVLTLQSQPETQIGVIFDPTDHTQSGGQLSKCVTQALHSTHSIDVYVRDRKAG